VVDFGNENGVVLCPVEALELEGVVRLLGDQRDEVVVLADVHCDVALGRLVGEGPDGVPGVRVPLDDHGVLALVRSNDETLVARDSGAGDDVHVALQLDVLFGHLVLDDSRVGRGLEQEPGLLRRQVVHRLGLVFVESYYFFQFYWFFDIN